MTTFVTYQNIYADIRSRYADVGKEGELSSWKRE